MSAMAMADPGSPRKHLLNGSSSNYFPSCCQSLGRRLSEPFLLSPQSDLLSLPPHLSKDDTYTVFAHEGSDRSPPKTLGSTFVSRPRFDPRQLLDPRGYNAVHSKKEEDSAVMVWNRILIARPQTLLTNRRSANATRAKNMAWET